MPDDPIENTQQPESEPEQTADSPPGELADPPLPAGDAAPDVDVNQDEIDAVLRAAEDEAADAAAETAALDPAEAEGGAAEPEGDDAPAVEATQAPARTGAATISADEIEAAMLAASEPSDVEKSAAASETDAAGDVSVSADEIEAAMAAALEEAEAAAAEKAEPVAAVAPAELPAGAERFRAPDFGKAEPAPSAHIDLLDDVELEVKIELGRTEMYIEDVLGLGPGSVVELDKAAGDPVDILVNDRLVARGEVLVLNESFCVRINDILSPIPELEQEA